MSSLQSLIFTRPKALRSASRDVLLAFLNPHRAIFNSRGVNLDDLSDPENAGIIDALTQTLLSPCQETPRALIDAIFTISELATPAAADALAQASAELTLPPEATAAETAMLLYLADPDAAERLHCERIPLRARAFEYFSAEEEGDPEFAPPTGGRCRRGKRCVSSAKVAHESSVFQTAAASLTAVGGIGAWGGESSTADPVEELDALIEELATQTGQMPNRLALGLPAWRRIRHNPQVIKRFPRSGQRWSHPPAVRGSPAQPATRHPRRRHVRRHHEAR